MICNACKKNVEVPLPIGRKEECPSCRHDLHVCSNCKHYDKNSYNECRETQADRVLEKDRSNFCDFFSPANNSEGAQPCAPTAAEIAKKKLEELFKKK